jgi:bifunctional non-homologous end joining protein LigD
MFPDDGITKGELAAYYETVAPYMLLHIRGRPITMKRYHRGIAAEGLFPFVTEHNWCVMYV